MRLLYHIKCTNTELFYVKLEVNQALVRVGCFKFSALSVSEKIPPPTPKVATFFLSQKMRNILKCMQKQFSYIFSFNKMFILSFCDFEIFANLIQKL